MGKLHGPLFLGSLLGESSRGLVQEGGQHQRTKSVFCTHELTQWFYVLVTCCHMPATLKGQYVVKIT